MIDFSSSILDEAYIHFVGNKLRNEGVETSKTAIDLSNDDTKSLFLKYTLGSFNRNEYYNFFHDSDLSLNEVYTYCSKIFSNRTDFERQSKNIANQLYKVSVHPKVMQGELYIVLLTGCIIENEVVEAIGIFKSETKESYLKPVRKDGKFGLENDKGVNVNKLDKGCLIFNTNNANGFKVCIIDSSNKNDEAQYWKDHFLGIVPMRDNYHSTKNYLVLAKDFVTTQLDQEFELTTSNKADYLNRSVEYFKTNEQFNERDFSKQVFGDADVIKSFKRFKEDYTERHDVDISDQFEIAPQVVKKQARAFKSILKLDKNFDIYIHSNADLIQHGVEKDGRKYYKIYYEQEK